MSRPDVSDAELRRAFAERLAAAPEPSSSMRERTFEHIAARPTPPAPARSWSSASRWYKALAAPARFALAAAIVVLGGTIGFGTVKVTREMTVVPAPPAAPVSIDGRAARLARSATLVLVVRDIPATLDRIASLTRIAHGAVLDSSGTRAPAHVRIRVPVEQLDTTLRTVATLGSLRAERILAVDLGAGLTATDRELERTASGPAASSPATKAGIERLRARRAALIERTANATLAITLYEAKAAAAVQHEPLPTALRRTGITLARGSRFATNDPLLAWRRTRALSALASRGFIVRSRPD